MRRYLIVYGTLPIDFRFDRLSDILCAKVCLEIPRLARMTLCAFVRKKHMVL